ncbi:MAG TPA: nucleotide exchange factor GrpE [Chthoniobacterales bacterium]|jgi:molecular chaperone GrpE
MSTEDLAEEKNTDTAESNEDTTETTAADPLTEALQEAAKYRDLALRGQADFDNFRKRAAREKDDAIRFANARLFESLLPILDNFELGLAAARNDAQGSSILMGLDMVFKQTQDFLADFGVNAIESVGQKFDPNLHEALAQEPSSDVAEGIVLRQVRKGYKLRDRLLRPANVVVSTGPASPEEAVTVSPETAPPQA